MGNSISSRSMTISDLPNDWEQVMMDAAQAGNGTVTWKVFLGLSSRQWEELLRNSERFSDCVEKCMLLQQKWYEDQGNRLIQGGAGSTKALTFMMTNKFGWTNNRTELVGDENKPLRMNSSVDVKKMTRSELMKRLEKRGLTAAKLEL